MAPLIWRTEKPIVPGWYKDIIRVERWSGVKLVDANDREI
jgi:hypothetical protein